MPGRRSFRNESGAGRETAGRPDPPGGVPRPGDSPLELLDVAYGTYPRIQALNPEFRPASRKIKLTLRIRRGDSLPPAGALIDPLSAILPSLGEHKCCGANSLRESFFRGGGRPRCDLEETDNGVDMAHLVEHAIIDIQHFVARMSICSGVTCAYTEPPDQYDVFVESPDETVGRTSAVIAVNLISDMLEGFPADPAYRCVMSLARLARDHEGAPIELRLSGLRARWGEERVGEAIEFLRRAGYLRRARSSFNFSGTPLLAFLPDADEERSSS